MHIQVPSTFKNYHLIVDVYFFLALWNTYSIAIKSLLTLKIMIWSVLIYSLYNSIWINNLVYTMDINASGKGKVMITEFILQQPYRTPAIAHRNHVCRLHQQSKSSASRVKIRQESKTLQTCSWNCQTWLCQKTKE